MSVHLKRYIILKLYPISDMYNIQNDNISQQSAKFLKCIPTFYIFEQLKFSFPNKRNKNKTARINEASPFLEMAFCNRLCNYTKVLFRRELQ